MDVRHVRPLGEPGLIGHARGEQLTGCNRQHADAARIMNGVGSAAPVPVMPQIIRSLTALRSQAVQVQHISFVRHRVGQEIAAAVFSFCGMWAFWAAPAAQNAHILHPWPLRGNRVDEGRCFLWTFNSDSV